MKHPLEKYQKSQSEFLSKCTPEEKKIHEYLFRVGNAAYIYHKQANKEISENTRKKYYKEWLAGLPENIRIDMNKMGYEVCKTTLPFTRYVNERTDIGLTDWMKENLSKEDFKQWNNHE